jgi:hypothetical protein
VIAARWGMLVVATWLVAAAFGTRSAELQPSGLRLVVTAVIALLAPLFWAGCAATPARTALRIAGWSAAAVGLAAVALQLPSHPGQPFASTLGPCAMLLLILLVTHSVAAAIEWRLRGPAGDAHGARAMAGGTAALLLAALGALPLWLGPAAELLSGRYEGVIDAVIGISPLTHLAVASGNDLLRNPWLYQHSNLAALQFSYPELAGLAWSYGTLLLGFAALAYWLARRPVANATPNRSTT